MFDGSTLPLEDNLRFSAGLLDELAPLGVVLEVESGVVGGEEDRIAGPAGRHSELYTTTEDLMRVASVLGTGERGHYLLAATFGNVHGVYAPGNVTLRRPFCVTAQLALAERYPGARFQCVFAAAAVANATRCAGRSPTASLRSTSTPMPNTPSPARSPTTSSPTTTAC